MGYALARWRRQVRRKVWQAYMAEALRLAGENAARLGGGPYLQIHYSDLLEPKPEETRTPQQVKQKMLKMLRGA